MAGIGEVNSTNVQPTASSATQTPDEEFLNSIFEIDKYGNNNGKVEEEDFNLALRTGMLNKDTIGKIENWYVTFLAKSGKGEVVGNHRTVTAEVPSLLGSKVTIKGIFDEKTGKLIVKTESKISEKDGITTVSTTRTEYGKKQNKVTEAKYSYSKELLEKHIMFEGVDNSGRPIKIFNDIPQIRKLPENMRTDKQKALLKEFDDMVNFAIKVGQEYNIDPKLVVSIMEREVGFDGFGKHTGLDVTGINGKGYMQLTTAPIGDFLYKTQVENKKKGIPAKYAAGTKESLYGVEMTDLLISRGFDVNAAQTTAQKKALEERIMAYLKKNTDPEFNIRLGTLTMRYYMNKANGNVKTAATNYNGSSGKILYGIAVSGKYEKMDNVMPNDSTYVRKTVPLR